MSKLFYGSFFCVLLFTACQSHQASSSKVRDSSSEEVAVVTEPTSPEELILGRWVSEIDPDTGFEPWAFFDKDKVYGDGNEEGTPYEFQEGKLIYHSIHGDTVTRVVELTASRFIEASEGDFRTVWTKADL